MNKGIASGHVWRSIFEMDLEAAFDDKVHPEAQWFDKFNEWLGQFNVGCLYLPVTESQPGGKPYAPGSEYLGYHIMEFTSVNLPNPEDGHVCVALNGTVIHNPREGQGVTADDVGEYRGAFLFVSLNPATVRRKS